MVCLSDEEKGPIFKGARTIEKKKQLWQALVYRKRSLSLQNPPVEEFSQEVVLSELPWLSGDCLDHDKPLRIDIN